MKETTHSDIIDSDTGVGPTLGSLLIIELEGHCHKKEKEKKKKRPLLGLISSRLEIINKYLLKAYSELMV